VNSGIKYLRNLGLLALKDRWASSQAKHMADKSADKSTNDSCDAGPSQSEYRLKTLFWECTLQCNQLCKQCGSNATHDPSDDLPAADILAVLKRLKQRLEERGLPLPFIAVTGGEPLMRKDLAEIMEAASHELGYAWGMTSNGLAFNASRIEQMRQAGMRTISVSVDGTETTHDYLRCSKGSYKVVIEHVRDLVAAGFLDSVQVTTIVNPLNISELPSLYEVMRSIKGLSSWRLAACDPIGRAAQDKELMLTAAQMRALLEFIVKHDSRKLPVFYACSSSDLGPYELIARSQPFYCAAGRQVMGILHNGDLAACPNIPHNEQTIQGNVRDTDIALDIYPVWEERYYFHRDVQAKANSECLDCRAWPTCHGGSLHTFDFQNKRQNQCARRMLEREGE
jgi:radical SAM protein with 4Fe4S-binding SPASM domain